MRKDNLYSSPIYREKLKLEILNQTDKEVVEGMFLDSKESYPIINGIPDFTYPKDLADIDEETRKVYENLANEYDKYADIPFRTFHSSESDEREKMTDKLHIQKDSVVLEVGAGDGRGAEHIVKRLGKNGKFYVQELSHAFLSKAIERLKKYEEQVEIEYSVASAMYLPFDDNTFDAALHFGGVNTFSDQKQFLKELVRVVKPGGRIVIGDESMAPWLRETQMGKVMMNSNPLLKYEIPFDIIPAEARDVRVEWIMLGAFFVLDFSVADGDPVADYHIPIPSERGGTHWTRYYGNLEGVTDQTKQNALNKARKASKSVHQWLEDLINNSKE